VLQAILGVKQELHHLSMVAFHRQSEERQGGARRGRPPLDHRLWPPPLHGRLWAGPGSLPDGALLCLS